MKDPDVVKEGDYVIIQRKNFLKVHQVTRQNDVMLGKDKLSVSALIGQQYWSTFKMIPKKGSKREFLLEKCAQPINLNETLVPEVEVSSGYDNRNITDDGKSQKLTTEEIVGFRDSGLSSSDIVGKLIENSTTFQSKTEYSQEKYLKKKEKKYYEYVTVRKPTLRLLSEVFYMRDKTKVMGLRHDSLSQLIAYANIRHNGNYLLFETGTQGLISASILNYLSDEGRLINITLGSHPQKHAILAMNYPDSKLKSLLCVKLNNIIEFLCAKEPSIQPDQMDQCQWTSEIAKKRKLENDTEFESKKPRWASELAEGLCILSKYKTDGLIVVTKEFSVALVETLIKFVKPCRPLIVFNQFREPLVLLYSKLKERKDILGLHITENFTRMYQVLPGRTHPHVTMSPNTGYLLTATVV